MPETRIDAFSTGEGIPKPYSVEIASTDGPSDQKETRWQNHDWTQWFGYYKKIPN